MGHSEKSKKIMICTLIIITYAFSFFATRFYIAYNVIDIDVFFITYQRVSYLMSLPLSLSLLYVFYSLRKSMVYRTLLLIGIIEGLYVGSSILSGSTDSFGNYSLLYTQILNIKIVISIGLLISATINKEKILTFVYLTMFLLMNIAYRLNIIDVIIDQRWFASQPTGNIHLVVTSIQNIYSFIVFIILLVIFYKYGEFKNGNQKEDEILLENY